MSKQFKYASKLWFMRHQFETLEHLIETVDNAHTSARVNSLDEAQVRDIDEALGFAHIALERMEQDFKALQELMK